MLLKRTHLVGFNGGKDVIPFLCGRPSKLQWLKDSNQRWTKASPVALLLTLKHSFSFGSLFQNLKSMQEQLKRLDEEFLMKVFWNRLREDIGAEVSLYEPQS